MKYKIVYCYYSDDCDDYCDEPVDEQESIIVDSSTPITFSNADEIVRNHPDVKRFHYVERVMAIG